MYKVAFVVPYFGRLPEHFNLWLLSCAYNRDFNWIIYTDDRREFDYPSNVHVRYREFADIKKQFQNQFDFTIALNSPYKLCDFRPAYGELFKDDLEEYDFWGYCDIDLIWGNLKKFITDDILKEHDKIFTLGHCSLYRNVPEVNVWYKNLGTVSGIGYKDIFSSNDSFVFDEFGGARNWGGINSMLLNSGKRLYSATPYDDIKIHYNNFCSHRLTPYSEKLIKAGKIHKYCSAYSFCEGMLLQHILIGKRIYTSESMYVHFQKRNMELNIVWSKNLTRFIMIPNQYTKYEEINEEVLSTRCRHKLIYINYIQFRFKNLRRKLMKHITILSYRIKPRRIN